MGRLEASGDADLLFGVGGLNNVAAGRGTLQRIAWFPTQLARITGIRHHDDVRETVHIPCEGSLGEERRRAGATLDRPGSELLEMKTSELPGDWPSIGLTVGKLVDEVKPVT